MQVQKMLQQGDVNICKIDKAVLPENAKPKYVESGVIREGETTGHAHRIVGTDFKLFQVGAQLIANILSGDCRIVHEEHGMIELEPGTYEFTPTIEYDHFAERSRRVRD